MKFIVQKEIFDKVDDLFIGIVVAKGIDNSKEYPEIEKMLNHSMEVASNQFLNKRVKEDDAIIPYREAFSKFGINPNKFQCSVEAMFSRISKGHKIPNINPLVNLNNAISLKYVLPMGTHDLTYCDLDMELRFSRDGDIFVPRGDVEVEHPDINEPVYAAGNQIRTRRWAWRQGKGGIITEDTNYVFFPIDGFKGFNDDKVMEAIKELKEALKNNFNCEVACGYVDKDNLIFEWDL